MFLILFLFIYKNQLNKLVLNMGCFLKLLKLDGNFWEKQTLFQNRIITQKNQYLNLKVSQHNKRSIVSLKKTGLKLVSRQEKRIFTTCSFSIHYWWRQPQWNYISCFHWKCQHLYLTDFHLYSPAIKYDQHENNTCSFSSLWWMIIWRCFWHGGGFICKIIIFRWM